MKVDIDKTFDDCSSKNNIANMNINKNQIAVFAGQQHKIWDVKYMGESEYAVTDRLSDAQNDGNIVEYSEHGDRHCYGTYFQYNDVCPHIQAVTKIKEIQDVDIINKDDAKDEMDLRIRQAVPVVDSDGDTKIILQDGNIGYVASEIKIKDDTIWMFQPSKTQIQSKVTVAYHMDVDRIYMQDDFDKSTLGVYLDSLGIRRDEIDELTDRLYLYVGESQIQ